MDKIIPCGVIVIFSIFIISYNTVSSIRCYDCRSDVDPGCADPFDNRSLPIIDCSKLSNNLFNGPPTMCRKMRQKVEGEWRYYRGCAYLGEPGVDGDERICNYSMGTYNIFVEYCNCKSKDGCNSSSNLQSSIVSFLTIIASGFLMMHITR